MVGMNRRRRERGGALLMVMWMSAALAAIAVSVSVTVRAEMEHTSTMGEGLRAHYLAVGSVERMIAWMSWGENAATANAWSRKVSRYYMRYPSGDVVVELISEASKVNINLAPAAEILPIVTAVVGDPVRAQQITNGIMARRTPGGGRTVFNPASTFSPLNASFEETEELLSVPGVTPELYYGNYVSDADGRMYARGGLRDVLSVWGAQNNRFDVNGAAPALLEGIGVPAAQVQEILRERAAHPIQSASQIPGGGNAHLSTDGITMWTIRANARLRNADGSTSEVVRSAGATVKYLDRNYQGSPVRVLRYYPDYWSDYAAKPPYIPAGARR